QRQPAVGRAQPGQGRGGSVPGRGGRGQVVRARRERAAGVGGRLQGGLGGGAGVLDGDPVGAGHHLPDLAPGRAELSAELVVSERVGFLLAALALPGTVLLPRRLVLVLLGVATSGPAVLVVLLARLEGGPVVSLRGLEGRPQRRGTQGPAVLQCLEGGAGAGLAFLAESDGHGWYPP